MDWIDLLSNQRIECCTEEWTEGVVPRLVGDVVVGAGDTVLRLVGKEYAHQRMGVEIAS